MINQRLAKRVSLALFASVCVHSILLALLVWKGGVFSPASLISGPLDLIEATVPAAPAPKTRHEPVPKLARVIPKRDLSIPTSRPEATDAGPPSNTEAAPLASPHGSTQANEPSEMSHYLHLLISAVQKNRRYPREAIDREQEGVVGLAVKLASNGELLEVAVKTPSPFTLLNEAAVKTVKAIDHFPKPPIAEGTVIELAIPIRFKIERL